MAREPIDDVMGEIKYVRSRLDQHIDDEDVKLLRLAEEVASLREGLAAERTRISMVYSVVASAIGAAVSWVITAHNK